MVVGGGGDLDVCWGRWWSGWLLWEAVIRTVVGVGGDLEGYWGRW